MSDGRLGTPGITVANSYSLAYTVPSTGAITSSAIKVYLCNTGTTSSKIRIAFSASTTSPSASEIQYYDQVIPENGGTFESTTCRLLSPGESILIFADTSTINYRIEGSEQSV